MKRIGGVVYRKRLDGMNWKQDRNVFSCFDYSAIWGEHPCDYISVYEHDVHLNYELGIILVYW